MRQVELDELPDDDDELFVVEAELAPVPDDEVEAAAAAGAPAVEGVVGVFAAGSFLESDVEAEDSPAGGFNLSE